MPRWLPYATAAMALMLAFNSVVGPFLLDAVDYGFSETIRNQAIGLDAVSLVLVAPLALAAAGATRRHNMAGPLLSLAVAGYTAYMMVQYLVGPDYAVAARIFPFQLALFALSVVVAFGAWNAARDPVTVARPRLTAGILFAVAAFVILRYLPVLAGSATEEALPDEYAENPAFFWTIVLMDLGLYVPATIAAGVGLLRGAAWAAKGAAAVVAWFAIVTIAVTAMGIAMLANDDPFASTGQVVMFVPLTVVAVAVAGWLFRPLLGFQLFPASAFRRFTEVQ